MPFILADLCSQAQGFIKINLGYMRDKAMLSICRRHHIIFILIFYSFFLFYYDIIPLLSIHFV